MAVHGQGQQHHPEQSVFNSGKVKFVKASSKIAYVSWINDALAFQRPTDR